LFESDDPDKSSLDDAPHYALRGLKARRPVKLNLMSVLLNPFVLGPQQSNDASHAWWYTTYFVIRRQNEWECTEEGRWLGSEIPAAKNGNGTPDMM
jgi:hypothetical protein